MTDRAADLECPYVGLAPFEAAHADYFFGRSLDSAVLADNVLARRITVLYGASGVGKSSVLNVGLPAAVNELGVAARIVSRRAWHEPALLGGWLDGVIDDARATPGQPLILILDQFEECFLYADAEQVKGFAKSLAALIARADLEAHLLFALRDDGLHRLGALRMHLPSLLETTLELRHLDESAVREAVEQPIAVWNERHRPSIVIDGDFAEALITQLRPKDDSGQPVKGGRIELAYLQLALEKIWVAEGGAKAAALRTATLTTRLQGIGEISRRHVEDVLGQRPQRPEFQDVCALLFDRLVTPSGTKIALGIDDLTKYAGVLAPTLPPALKMLADGRILRAILPPGKPVQYEIFHDILASAVTEWRARYLREKERRETEQKVAAREAERERELRAAEARAKSESAKRRRTLWAAGVIGMLLIVALYLARQARIAEQRAMDAQLLAARSVERLELFARLRRDDPQPVALAVEQLVNEHQEPIKNVVESIPESRLRENKWFASVVLALDDVVGRAGADVRWAAEARRALLSAAQRAKNTEPAPSPALGDPLNRLVRIDDGSLRMGSPPGGEGDADERPQRVVTLSAFLIQEHEVTNAEYQRFDPTRRGAAPNMPVVNVSWYDAMAYAIWMGGSLPSEAQWEFAARGVEGRAYPWGAELPSCERSNFLPCGFRLTPAKAGRDRGATPERVYDLAGNAREWCRDYYGAYPAEPQRDPAGAAIGEFRVVRGGAFTGDASYLRAAGRSSLGPDSRSYDLGFRVVVRSLRSP